MTPPGRQQRPIRLFLDAGVIIQGCWTPWGAAKAVLILATIRDYYTIVLAESVEDELARAEANRLRFPSESETADFSNSISGWFQRVRVERHPRPDSREVYRYAPVLLPAIRHNNDLASVVTAIQAKPDWVISTNEDHWNEALAQRAGLRIMTPWGFLQQISASFVNR